MKKLHILTWVLTLLCCYSCKKDKSTGDSAVPGQTADRSAPSGGYSTFTYDVTADPNLIPVDTANKMINSYIKSLEDSDGNLHSFSLDAETLREYLKDTSIKKVKVMFAHTQSYINSGHEGQPSGMKSNALTIVLAGYRSDGTFVIAPGDKVLDRAQPCPTICPAFGNASNDLIQ